MFEMTLNIFLHASSLRGTGEDKKNQIVWMRFFSHLFWVWLLFLRAACPNPDALQSQFENDAELIWTEDRKSVCVWERERDRDKGEKIID